MFFEIVGFVSGMAGIGVAFGLLLKHERERVIGGFYRDRRRARGGNALIWPSR